MKAKGVVDVLLKCLELCLMGMRSSQEDKRGNAREMLRRDVTEGKECFEGREKALGRVTRSQRNQQGSQSTGSRRF